MIQYKCQAQIAYVVTCQRTLCQGVERERERERERVPKHKGCDGKYSYDKSHRTNNRRYEKVVAGGTVSLIWFGFILSRCAMLFVRTLWQFCKHLVGICVICEIKLDTHGADLLLVVFYINI